MVEHSQHVCGARCFETRVHRSTLFFARVIELAVAFRRDSWCIPSNPCRVLSSSIGKVSILDPMEVSNTCCVSRSYRTGSGPPAAPFTMVSCSGKFCSPTVRVPCLRPSSGAPRAPSTTRGIGSSAAARRICFRRGRCPPSPVPANARVAAGSDLDGVVAAGCRGGRGPLCCTASWPAPPRRAARERAPRRRSPPRARASSPAAWPPVGGPAAPLRGHSRRPRGVDRAPAGKRHRICTSGPAGPGVAVHSRAEASAQRERELRGSLGNSIARDPASPLQVRCNSIDARAPNSPAHLGVKLSAHTPTLCKSAGVRLPGVSPGSVPWRRTEHWRLTPQGCPQNLVKIRKRLFGPVARGCAVKPRHAPTREPWY